MSQSYGRRMMTSSELFEKRGDLWMTQRDREKEFGTPGKDDNPDLDRYTQAGKPQWTGKGSLFSKAKSPVTKPADKQRRITSIVNKMHMKLLKLSKIET